MWAAVLRVALHEVMLVLNSVIGQCRCPLSGLLGAFESLGRAVKTKPRAVIKGSSAQEVPKWAVENPSAP